MIIPVPRWFGEYIQEHRHMPMSAWGVPHYYVYHSRWGSPMVFFCNNRWYLDTNPRSNKAIEFAAKMDKMDKE